eukprot:6344802-Ditylum_brightwellii.AAC.1
MQEVFVERLVATIATPEQFKESNQVVSALAAAATVTTEGSKSLDSLMEGIQDASDSEVERIGALLLAAAALVAFLTQYAENSQDHKQVKWRIL